MNEKCTIIEFSLSTTFIGTVAHEARTNYECERDDCIKVYLCHSFFRWILGRIWNAVFEALDQQLVAHIRLERLIFLGNCKTYRTGTTFSGRPKKSLCFRALIDISICIRIGCPQIIWYMRKYMVFFCKQF